MEILYSFLRLTDRLLDVLFLLLVLILKDFYEPRRQDGVTEENYIEEFV